MRRRVFDNINPWGSPQDKRDGDDKHQHGFRPGPPPAAAIGAPRGLGSGARGSTGALPLSSPSPMPSRASSPFVSPVLPPRTRPVHSPPEPSEGILLIVSAVLFSVQKERRDKEKRGVRDGLEFVWHPLLG